VYAKGFYLLTYSIAHRTVIAFIPWDYGVKLGVESKRVLSAIK